MHQKGNPGSNSYRESSSFLISKESEGLFFVSLVVRFFCFVFGFLVGFGFSGFGGVFLMLVFFSFGGFSAF